MDLLIVSATQFEIQPLYLFIKEQAKEVDTHNFELNGNKIQFLVTGVGMLHTSYFLTKTLSVAKPHLVLNVGIAGSFRKEFQLGSVYKINKQILGDLGVEEADQTFTDVFDMELMSDSFPFKAKSILNESIEAFNFLPSASCLTVNKVHGSTQSINLIQKKYDVDLEVMEGAAVAFVCAQEKVNYIELRSVSNYVESRNKDNWNIPLAIEQLNKSLIEIVNMICSVPQ